MHRFSYKDAGVDLEIYRESMQRLPRLLRRTHSARVLALEGGFAGLFQLDFAERLFARNYREPVLVACSDGVGTKLKVAQRCQRHDTIGIDLVAMSVNDALCCGAEPLFFLDYVAMPHDNPELLEQIVSGVSDGCLAAECALLGGETAILPDVYQPGDYDLAGFCVGVVERSQVIDGKSIVPGDIILAVASSGLHSNGYSLARKIVFEHAGLDVTDYVAELGETVGQALLRPTLIYSGMMRHVLGHYRIKQVVHGVAHVTGGGIRENLERIVPAERQAKLDEQSWTVPPLFSWLQSLGNVDRQEMFRVFNMGVGLVLVVSPYYADHIRGMAQSLGNPCWVLGEIT